MVFKTSIHEKILNNAFVLEYTKNNDATNTKPSIFNETILNNEMVLQTNQTANVTQFNLGYFSSYNFNLKKVKGLIKLQLVYKNENVKSNFQQGFNQDLYANYPYSGDFTLNAFKVLTTLELTCNWRKFMLGLKPEILILNLSQNEMLNSNLNERQMLKFFQPSINLGYEFNENFSVNTNFRANTQTSTFENLYSSLVLKNYDILFRNPSNVNVYKNYIGSIFFNYKDIYKGFYVSNNTSLNKTTSDFTISSNLDTNGLICTLFVLRPNITKGISNTTYLSKRFFKILNTDLSYTFRNNLS